MGKTSSRVGEMEDRARYLDPEEAIEVGRQGNVCLPKHAQESLEVTTESHLFSVSAWCQDHLGVGPAIGQVLAELSLQGPDVAIVAGVAEFAG